MRKPMKRRLSRLPRYYTHRRWSFLSAWLGLRVAGTGTLAQRSVEALYVRAKRYCAHPRKKIHF